MSNKLYEESDVQAIANAIRTKNGSSDTYMVSEMAQAVLDIPTGTTPTGTKQITISSAGTTTENVSAFANCEITVPQGQYKPNIDATPTNPSITVSNGGLITAEVPTQYVNDLLKPTFTEGYVKSSDVSMKVKIGGSATRQLNTVNGQTVTPTTSQQSIAVQGDYILGAINVGPIPSEYVIPTGTKSISQNGQGINVKDYEYVNVSVSGANIKTGTFTLTSDSQGTTPVEIVHNAGFVPKLIVVWTEAYTSSSPPTTNANVGFVYAPNIVDFPQRLSSSASSTYGIYIPWVVTANATVVNSATSTSTSYMPTSASVPTSTSFFLFRQTNNYYWKSGITYKYFLSDSTTMGWGT